MLASARGRIDVLQAEIRPFGVPLIRIKLQLTPVASVFKIAGEIPARVECELGVGRFKLDSFAAGTTSQDVASLGIQDFGDPGVRVCSRQAEIYGYRDATPHGLASGKGQKGDDFVRLTRNAVVLEHLLKIRSSDCCKDRNYRENDEELEKSESGVSSPVGCEANHVRQHSSIAASELESVIEAPLCPV